MTATGVAETIPWRPDEVEADCRSGACEGGRKGGEEERLGKRVGSRCCCDGGDK